MDPIINVSVIKPVVFTLHSRQALLLPHEQPILSNKPQILLWLLALHPEIYPPLHVVPFNWVKASVFPFPKPLPYFPLICNPSLLTYPLPPYHSSSAIISAKQKYDDKEIGRKMAHSAIVSKSGFCEV